MAHALGQLRRAGARAAARCPPAAARRRRLQQPLRPRAGGRLAIVQQRVEFGGHQFAHLAQAIEQRRRRAQARPRLRAIQPSRRRPSAAGASAGRRGTGCGARRGAGRRSPRPARGGGRLHQAGAASALEALQRRAGADLGELPAARHQHQLHDELDLADAAARQLHVVGALGPAGGAALRFVADLAVQLAQAFEHAVVEVAAVDEGRATSAQRQRAAAGTTLAAARPRGSSARQSAPIRGPAPGGTPPASAASHRRAGVAVRPQRQVDAEDEAVVGGLADQRVQRPHRAKYSCALMRPRGRRSRRRPRRRRSGRCRRTRSARARRACPCRRSRAGPGGRRRRWARRAPPRHRPAPAGRRCRGRTRPARS